MQKKKKKKKKGKKRKDMVRRKVYREKQERSIKQIKQNNVPNKHTKRSYNKSPMQERSLKQIKQNKLTTNIQKGVAIDHLIENKFLAKNEKKKKKKHVQQ